MTVSALLFAAVAHADRLDPFPWTPYERQFVPSWLILVFKLSADVGDRFTQSTR